MQKKMKIWFWLMIISSTVYIVWRTLFTLPFGYGVVAMIAGIALFVSELISVSEAIIQYICMSRDKEIELPKIDEADYPDVDVFIATHSEEDSLLFKTVNGCIHMEYPDKNKVHIYLCDDSNRPEIKKLAERMKVGYFGLSGNKDAKAGNLNNAISKTDSPLIVTFDADMIPRSNFLLETVGYFFLPKMIKENGVWRKRREEEIDPDYKIGFIQTPQSFYNPDLFQYNFYAENNIPNEQDFFFREINVGRNSSNSPIYAGSNTIISRAALEEVGGIRTKTITEDFATGIDIQKAGYSCYAIPTVLASGLAPESLPELIKQRQRWGRGCVQNIRSLKFLFSKMPIMTKLSYLSCLFYWWTFLRRIVYIMSPILFATFGVVAVKVSDYKFLIVWAMYFLIYNHSLKLLSGKTRDQKWSNIVDTILSPYLILPILAETVGFKMNQFKVTNKGRLNGKNAKLIYAIPHIILLAATLVGLVYMAEDIILYKNPVSLLVIFWLIMNAYFLLMAVFFMTGRINLRSAERFVVQIPIKFNLNGVAYQAMTADLSEYGLAFVTDFPEFFDGVNEFELEDGKWKAHIKGTVVHVRQLKNKWKYSLKLEELSQEEQMNYCQLLFDRTPTLATEIKSNVWTDLTNFLKRKTSKDVFSNRALPRINVNLQYDTLEAGKVILEDFNYRYATISGTDLDTLTMKLTETLVLKLKKAKTANENVTLYEVLNWKEVSGTSEMRKIVADSFLKQTK